jgi:hypothetical protein
VLLEFAELFFCAFFTRQVSKFEKDYQMVVKLTVFEDLLHQLRDKQTVFFSTLAEQHKILFFIGLLVIFKYALYLTQKLEVIRIVILSAASLI